MGSPKKSPKKPPKKPPPGFAARVKGRKPSGKDKGKTRSKERVRKGLPPVPPPDTSPLPTPDPDPLSPLERAFVESYLIDYNATWAYWEASGNRNYDSCRAMGAHLLNTPRVKAEVRAGVRAQVGRTRFRADSVLRELLWIAHADPAHFVNPDGSPRGIRQIPKRLRRCIASVETTPVTRYGGGEPKYKLWSKTEALKALALLAGYNEPLRPQELIERTLQLLSPQDATEFRQLLAGRVDPSPVPAE